MKVTSEEVTGCHTIEPFRSELANVRRALGVGPPPRWDDLKSLNEDLELRTTAGEETPADKVLLRSGFPRGSMTMLMTKDKQERLLIMVYWHGPHFSISDTCSQLKDKYLKNRLKYIANNIAEFYMQVVNERNILQESDFMMVFTNTFTTIYWPSSCFCTRLSSLRIDAIS